MSCEYVRQHYGVPACIGRRVVAYGKPGIITADRGHYIGIALDDDPKHRINNYHPTHEIVYGDMAEKLPKPPKRSNYDKFQDDDTGLDFHEWLGINKPRFETRGRWPYEYRMHRYNTGPYTSCIEGEWASTKKAAKASYKVALKAYHDSTRAARLH